MLSISQIANGWAESWFRLMVAILWQSAILVAVAALIASWLRRSSPVVRNWLWQIVAIKLLLMPFWTLAVPMPNWSLSARSLPAATSLETQSPALPADFPLALSGTESTGTAQPPAQPVPQPMLAAMRQVSWQWWLLFGWCVVVVAQFAVVGRQHLMLRRLLRAAAPAREPLRALIADLAAQIGLRRVPVAVVSDADCSFFACGAWRPVLVLPQSLLTTLDTGQLRQVLLHELAHVKRFDLIFGWPAEIARRLFFFNPLVYWVANRIRLERELACDQLAMIGSGRGPSDYINTLVHVVAHTSQPVELKTAAISAGLEGGIDMQSSFNEGNVVRKGEIL